MSIDPRRAWEPYRPSADNPWDLRKVGHLYRRAAFGATWDELQAGVAAGPEKTIGALLAGGGDGPAFPESIKKGNVGPQIPAWWLVRLRETQNPLREKMTIFWHNHFATSNAKVNNAGYMIAMIDLFYRHALGNFGALLQDVSKDPAMLVWLDGAGRSVIVVGGPLFRFVRMFLICPGKDSCASTLAPSRSLPTN